jgi:hypothetical protein
VAVKSVREHGKPIHKIPNESGKLCSTLQKRLKQGLVSACKMRRKAAFSEEREQALTDHLERLLNM